MNCSTCEKEIVDDNCVEVEQEDLELDTKEKRVICSICALKIASDAGIFGKALKDALEKPR